jgi:hypothetical protein
MESLRGQVTCGRRSKTRAAKGEAPALPIRCPAQPATARFGDTPRALRLPLTSAEDVLSCGKLGEAGPRRGSLASGSLNRHAGTPALAS